MQLKRLIGSRDFYRTLMATLLPILIQNTITNFIGLLDNVMVGRIGTEQMSGVSIVNQLLFVFNLCVFGAVSGAGLFGAQFFGKKDHEGVRQTFRFKLIFNAIVLAIALAALVGFGDSLIQLYLHEGSETGDIALTAAYAEQYLAIMLLGLIPYTLTQVYASTLREIGHTLPPMVAGLAGMLVNLVLNYLLIFGKCGLPAMGVAGAAVATVLSRVAELLIVCLWTHLHSHRCEFIKGAYRSLHISRSLAKRILITGTPLMLNETIWAAGQAMLLQCFSTRGIAVVSAVNICNTVSNTFAVLYLSVGSAISILLGHILGRGELKEAREKAKQLIAFSCGMGMLAALALAVCAPLFPLLYRTTDEVRSLATQLTFVVSLSAPLSAVLNASYFTLRSGGKTLLTFLFDSGYLWVVTVALAYFLSAYTALPALVMFIVCHCADGAKAFLGVALVRRGTWATDMTRQTS